MISTYRLPVLMLLPLLLGFWAPSAWTDDSAQDFACAEKMSTEGQAALTEYQTLLKEYYLADQPTSGQVSEAVDYYRSFQVELDRIFQEGQRLDEVKTFDLVNDEIAACFSVQSNLLEVAQVYLQGYTASSANTKRTFRIHDAFDVFNGQMEEFVGDFQAVFPGQFQHFDNALPCYAQQCL